MKSLKGQITPPADKSISHRALILGALSKGKTKIKNLLESGDVFSTLKALRKLGIKIEKKGKNYFVKGGTFRSPYGKIDCGNSGTTMRLLAGVISGFPIKASLTGDESLSRRPMKRVIEPLSLMGAKIKSKNGFPPLHIEGSNLKGIKYVLPVPSAQVKSAILLAGLSACGKTTVVEKIPSRDHTERMLEALGAKIEKKKNSVTVFRTNLKGGEITVPGDISSASFFIAAALLLKSEIKIKNTGVNPTRCGFINALRKMGAKIKFEKVNILNNEPVADIVVKKSVLHGENFSSAEIPSMIDEIPLLALVATCAQGKTKIRGAGELRLKESDRITATYEGLKRMSAKIKEFPDGFEIKGPTILQGASVRGFNDHRIIMMLAIASLAAQGKTVIDDISAVKISFPDFFKMLKKVVRG